MKTNPGKVAFFGGLAAMLGIGGLAFIEARFGKLADVIVIPIMIGCFAVTMLAVLRAVYLDKNKKVDMHDGEDWSIPYQAQMQQIKRIVYPSMAVFFLSVGSLFFILNHLPSIGGMAIIAFGVTGVLLTIFGLLRWAKCPACGELPLQQSYGLHGGVPLHLDHCPRCHAVLNHVER
ncbi:hypothetical protein ACFL53_00355 [Pseudomonadota bacterium]